MKRYMTPKCTHRNDDPSQRLRNISAQDKHFPGDLSQWSDHKGPVKMNFFSSKEKKQTWLSQRLSRQATLCLPPPCPAPLPSVVPVRPTDSLPVLRLGLNSRLVLGGGRASGAVSAARVRYRGGVNSSCPEKLLRTLPDLGRLHKLTGFFPTGIFLSKHQVRLQ